jgi:hypothetical protein
MEGNDIALVGSIILAISALVWLAFEIQNAPTWEDFDPDSLIGISRGSGGYERSPEALNLETELLFCYPLDPFVPALLWRPLPQDAWIEAQEGDGSLVANEHGSEFGSEPSSVYVTT